MLFYRIFHEISSIKTVQYISNEMMSVVFSRLKIHVKKNSFIKKLFYFYILSVF